MGCDIHIFAEKKVNNKWVKVEDHFSLDDFNRNYLKKEKGDSPFNWRSYAMFGFLGNVRNYSHSEFLSDNRGLPDDSEYLNEEIDDGYTNKITRKNDLLTDGNYHSYSYLTLKELLDFDYNKIFWDRRIMKQVSPNGWNGACLAEEGEGEHITYRNHLGDWFFTHLNELKKLGNPDEVRIVFWFNN